MQSRPVRIVLLSDSDKLIGNGFKNVEAPNSSSGPLAFYGHLSCLNLFDEPGVLTLLIEKLFRDFCLYKIFAVGSDFNG